MNFREEYHSFADIYRMKGGDGKWTIRKGILAGVFLLVLAFLLAAAGHTPGTEYKRKAFSGKEKLVLRRDSSFNYYFHVRDFRVESSGKWQRSGDTIILNSLHNAPGWYMHVEELPDTRQDSLRFYVYDEKGHPLREADVIFRRWARVTNVNGAYHAIPYTHIDSFRMRIQDGVYYYGFYKLKNKSSTTFSVRLFTNQGKGEWFFANKKYLLAKETICPLGKDFCLKRVRKGRR